MKTFAINFPPRHTPQRCHAHVPSPESKAAAIYGIYYTRSPNDDVSINSFHVFDETLYLAAAGRVARATKDASWEN